MDLSFQRQQVAHALRRLDASLARLVEALAHRSVAIQVEAADNERLAVRRACAAYSAIHYATHDAAEDSIVCLGVIGVPVDVLRQAQAVNTAKAALKSICTPLRGLQ